MTKSYYQAQSIHQLLDSLPADFGTTLDVCGCVYGFEVGNAVKIGVTQDPIGRLSTWHATYKNFYMKIGRAAISIPHFKARATEQGLHATFKGNAVRKEFFAIPFETFLREVSAFGFKPPSSDELAHYRRVLSERQAENSVQFKKFCEQLLRPKVSQINDDVLSNLISASEEIAALPWAVWILKDFEEHFGLLTTQMATNLGKRCVALSRDDPKRSQDEILAAVTDEFYAEYLASEAA